MGLYAAVTTGHDAGAIATVEVLGEGAGAAVGGIFISSGKQSDFSVGEILYGHIVEGEERVDEVTVGVERKDLIAIHCHGNPLIVQRVMGMLAGAGAECVDGERFEELRIETAGGLDTIEREVLFCYPRAMSFSGARLILGQAESGLRACAKRWVGANRLEEIVEEARVILGRSKAAEVIIGGCKAAIAGPPNSGKSTLLNALCGQEKAIVTHIEGTTRDYVTAESLTEPVLFTLVDTAGVDMELGLRSGKVEREAQEVSLEIVDGAGLVLLVVDGSCGEVRVDEELQRRLAGKAVVLVRNKADLRSGVKDIDGVCVSAKFGTGLNELRRVMVEAVGAGDFDLVAAVCFTERQMELVRRLSECRTGDEAMKLAWELLYGKFRV